jgi:hypothetical protein
MTWLRSENGRIVVSVILGFGLASLFRKACKHGDCMVVTGPTMKDVSDRTYMIDERCYVYKPLATQCTRYEEDAESTKK